MKQIFVLLATAGCLALACNDSGQTDSVKTAENKNAAKDSSATVLGISNDSLDFDKDFMVEAASGNLLEVQLGGLAQKNASAASVKEFGKMMMMDHTKSNTELATLAKSKNITVPTTPGKEAQEHISKLQGEKGADFDKDYASLMVDDHKEDIDKFEKAADKAKDPDIKAFAAKTLPVLKQHLQKIQAIHDGMK